MKGINGRSASLRLKLSAVSMALVGACLFAAGCGASAPVATDYADSGNWAYLETDVAGRDADVFFVCPSVYAGEEDANNMPLDDEESKESFGGAINMDKGIS